MKNAVTVLKMTAARWPSSAICGGLPFPQAGLTAETAWKAGESEVICLHGGLRLGRLPSLGKVGIEKIVFEILEI